MPLPKEATEANIKSIMAGNAVLIGNQTYTKVDMDEADLAKGYVGSDALLTAENEARLMLSKELDGARAQIAELEAKVKDGAAGEEAQSAEPFPHAELLDALMPSSASDVKALNKKTLGMVADYKKVPTDGKDDETLRADVLKALKEGE